LRGGWCGAGAEQQEDDNGDDAFHMSLQVAMVLPPIMAQNVRINKNNHMSRINELYVRLKNDSTY
jgi:hypothetical protein